VAVEAAVAKRSRHAVSPVDATAGSRAPRGRQGPGRGACEGRRPHPRADRRRGSHGRLPRGHRDLGWEPDPLV